MRDLIVLRTKSFCENLQYSIVLRELTLPNRPARIHSTPSPPETPWGLGRDTTEASQRLYEDIAEDLQRSHMGYTETPQRLRIDSAETLQELHRDSAEDSRDSTETPEILQKLSADSHRILQWFHN